MKDFLGRGSALITIIAIVIFPICDHQNIQAQTPETWWDEAWPYRVTVQVNEPGPASISLNFTQLFAELGLVDAILDLKSIRVVPTISGEPGSPVLFQETYSTLFFDGETLISDPSSGEPYWHANIHVEQSLDESKATEGTHAIKSTLEVQTILTSLFDFIYYFNDSPISDWSQYESFTYDLWPEVNQSALDQSPDLFQFELLGLEGCISNMINSPALALNQWNHITVPLAPFGDCTTPDASTLSGLRFLFQLDMFGDEINYYDSGDQITLWMDNFRLVDQDGGGEIRWNAEPGIGTYTIYFDTLNHTGHDTPTLGNFPPAETEAIPGGPAEAGGYFHQISGAETTDLDIWTAPTSEKILRGQAVPVNHSPLEIKAAKGEFEALQVIVHSPTDQALPVSISDLTLGEASIPASAVQIYRVDYVPLTRLSDEFGRLTEWPDPLYPILPGQPVTFPAGENQPLWFRIKIPEKTPAGQYSGEISIGAATIPFSLTVWDFNLPEQHTLPFTAGLDLATLVEAYGGSHQGDPQPCYENLVTAINHTLETYHITALPPETAPSPGLVYNLTDYPQVEAHDARLESGEPIWWSFTVYDRPPFANPAVMDRPGQDARILPWMAWANQVDGLYYHQLTDWDTDPWEEPFTNLLANGDGFLFYPPRGDSVGFDPCNPNSNRLIPSIRLELLREGLEDYAYLRLLNEKTSRTEPATPNNSQIDPFLSSRTLYQRVPTELDAQRASLANQIIAKQTEIFFPVFTH
jgi:hypothetical protein